MLPKKVFTAQYIMAGKSQLCVRGSCFFLLSFLSKCAAIRTTNHHGTWDATSVTLHYSHQARWICTDNSNHSVTALLSIAPGVLNRCRNECNNIWWYKLLREAEEEGGCPRFWTQEYCSWKIWGVWQHITGFDESFLPQKNCLVLLQWLTGRIEEYINI